MLDLFEQLGHKYQFGFDESYWKRHVQDSNRIPDKEDKSDFWNWYEIRGNNGFIYHHSRNQLAVYFQGGKRCNGIRRKYPQWQCIQDAEDEGVFLFDSKEISNVLYILQPKRLQKVA